MTRSELASLLARAGVPDDLYSLHGGMPYEAMCLDEAHGRWFVYYTEKGSRWLERSFWSEEEACAYFLHLMRGDLSLKPLLPPE